MRDILFVSILLGLVPVSLRRPWLGILAWYWTAYFVPQGVSWGFARSFPFAMVVGSATLLGFIFTKDRKPLPRNAVTFFMLALTVQITLTTIVAYNQDAAWVIWNAPARLVASNSPRLIARRIVRSLTPSNSATSCADRTPDTAVSGVRSSRAVASIDPRCLMNR